jgi:hypothetical protein
MIGLFRRLAIQALGTSASAPGRIRAAVTARAPVPLTPFAKIERELVGQRSAPSATPPSLQSVAVGIPAAIPASGASNDSPFATPTIERIATPTLTVLRPALAHLEEQVAASDTPPPASRDSFATPRRLLDEIAAPSSAPPVDVPDLERVATPSSPDRQSAHDEVTEVHVHIGRIEVTAPKESGSSKKPRSARPPNRSLADYLSRRTRI